MTEPAYPAWPFVPPPYKKSCGACGFQYEAKTIDAGVPAHECTLGPPLTFAPTILNPLERWRKWFGR